MEFRVRDLILKCTTLIYLAAFGSIYCQAPGLYGDNGILPIRLVSSQVAESSEESSHRPIVAFAGFMGLTAMQLFELLCLIGISLSFIAFIWCTMRNSVTFFLLWIFYQGLYQVGQTFLWFQWDILLLEMGILCVILSFPSSRDRSEHHDNIGLFMVRWLLFRLMFMSGVVKLTSECPTWWGLTALDWHYESQCIPTPAAWYFHQLPSWFQRLSVVGTLFIEIPVPFLFFSPIRNLRLFSFYLQVFLQILIIITGNYNFFNLLTLTLCLSLLRDEDLPKFFHRQDINLNLPRPVKSLWQTSSNVIQKLISLLIYICLISGTVAYFNIRVDFEDMRIKSRIMFSKEEFYVFLRKSVPLSIYVGALSLVWSVTVSFFRCIREEGIFRKVRSFLFCICVCGLSVSIFTMSLVPYTTIDDECHSKLPHSVKSLYRLARRYSFVNGYGLFRSMTGVGGRPEVIIEGSEHSTSNLWKEYEFFYKPGNITRKPPVVAPHQPRLDWQMWFAALGSYEYNPWFINLVYRLLTNEPDVLDLIQYNPFPHYPPKYVRARSYTYHYTAVDRGKNLKDSWWWREYSHDYLPPVSLEDQGLLNYLRGSGILGRKPKQRSRNFLTRLVENIRSRIGQPEGFNFVGMLILTCLIAKLLGSSMQ